MSQNTSVKATATTEKGMTVVKPSTDQNPDPKATVSAPTEPATPTPLTIDQRLKKINELFKLSERREQLVSSLSDVNDFYIEPTGSANLRLDDGNNHKFSISRPAIIEKIIVLVKSELLNSIAAVDAEIQF